MSFQHFCHLAGTSRDHFASDMFEFFQNTKTSLNISLVRNENAKELLTIIIFYVSPFWLILLRPRASRVKPT